MRARLKTKYGTVITATGNQVRFGYLMTLSISEFKELYPVALILPEGAETIMLNEVFIAKKDDDTIVFGVDDFGSIRTSIEVSLDELTFINRYTK